MKNLGILLIEFFELYGKSFNYREVGIGLEFDQCYYFERDPYQYTPRPGVISLLDPQDSCMSPISDV